MYLKIDINPNYLGEGEMLKRYLQISEHFLPQKTKVGNNFVQH